MVNIDSAATLDLVEGGAERRVDSRWFVGAALIALLIAAGAGFLVGRGSLGTSPAPNLDTSRRGGPQAMTGEMVLSPVRSTEVDADGGRREGGDGEMTGTITLKAQGSHTGTVWLHGSTSTAAEPDATVYHGWGTIHAVLDDGACTGTYAWSYFAAPSDNGGSVHLRCKDGRLLAGRLTVTSVDRPLSGTGTWRVGVRVEDGFYLGR